jgi:hypothetical protein
VGLVTVLLVVEDVGLVVVADVVGLVVVVVVVVVVVELLLELVEDVVPVLVLLRQSLDARSVIVAAPWPRFCTSVVLTVDGRFAIALLNDRAAPDAAPHWPEATAELIDASWLFRLPA